jgi:hypothetical protein
MMDRLLTAAAIAVLLLCAPRAGAGTITLGGVISQSTQDTGTPAVGNTSLNNILDGDAFSVVLNFTDPITSPGTFTTSVLFTDASATATESGFISGTMVITPSGALSQFAIVGCLIDASSCGTGNQLALDFQIPTTLLSQTGVSVQSIPALLPADLLEDGGSTDIQGGLSTYAYTGSVGTATPEPSTAALTLLGIATGLVARRRRQA